MIIRPSTILIACLVLAGCASTTTASQKQWTEVTTHLPDVEGKAEHDEVQNAEGTTTEYYPNRQTPQRITYRFPQGGFIEVRCLTGELHCRHWEMKVIGFRPGVPPAGFHVYLAEGVYTLTATEDPWVEVVKNQDQLTIGYWVSNRHGQGAAMVKTYAEAVSLRDR